MSDIIDLKTANYKGVELIFDSLTTTGGNRQIIFNYPGSDKQSVERQGQLPKRFSFKGIIPHENYFEIKEQLLSVLEDGVVGVLILPTFGQIENITNKEYTLLETITELGRASITIEFIIDDSSGIPEQSTSLAAAVNSASLDLNSGVSADFSTYYDVDTKSPGNVRDAVAATGNAFSAINRVSDFVNPLSSDLSKLKQDINRAIDNVVAITLSTPQLVSQISGLINSVNNLFGDPRSGFNAVATLFDYLEKDPAVRQVTVALKKRKNTRDLIRTNVEVLALSYAYVQAAQIDFTTEGEIVDTQNILEKQYLKIKSGNLIDNSTTNLALPENPNTPNASLLSNETLEALDRVRTKSQEVFELIRLNTSAIITINTKLIPLSVLVYNYYGSTDLVNDIADLNGIAQNAFVEGDIRILTV